MWKTLNDAEGQRKMQAPIIARDQKPSEMWVGRMQDKVQFDGTNR